MLWFLSRSRHSPASRRALRPLGRVQNLFSLHDSYLAILLAIIYRLFALLGPISNALIVAAWVDAEDATDVVAVAWDRKLAERVAPLVEEAPDGFPNFVFAVLGVVTRAGDGVNGAGGVAVLKEDTLEVRNRLVWVKSCV
jgi:hypothetical protein